MKEKGNIMETHEGKGKYNGNSGRKREILWQLMKGKGNIIATHGKVKYNGNS